MHLQLRKGWSPLLWISTCRRSCPSRSGALLCLILKSRTPFAQLLRISMRLQRDSEITASTLFPIPLPRHLDGQSLWGRMSFGAPRKKRERVHLARLLEVIVLALNFWHFQGFHFDVELLKRTPTSTHRRFYEFIRASLRSEMSAEAFFIARAGRRFPQLSARLTELCNVVTDLGISGSPYSRSFQGREVTTDNSVMPELEPYRDLCPERITLFGSGHWDATQWLDDQLVMGYREPDSLLLFRTPGHQEYPALRDSYDAILDLAKLWDRHHLLYLHDVPVPHFQKVRIFCAYKNETTDRQIGDRRGRNAVEKKLFGPSSQLPQGDDLSAICLDVKTQTLRIGVSDRRDFYHQFWASKSRCISNTIFPMIKAEDLKETQAYEEYLLSFSKKRYTRGLHGDRLDGSSSRRRKPEALLSCSFASILQGDQGGVEYATSAHQNFLACNGALAAEGLISSSRPPSADEIFEGLVIDDYFCISVEPHDKPPHHSRAASRHSKAIEAYAKENLLGSPSKDVVGEDKAKIIGAQIDSTAETRKRNQCRLAAPSQKRLALSWVSMQLARMSHTTDSLHLCLIGGWTSALLFRRPFMSVLSKSYALVDGNDVDSNHPKLVPISREICNELLLLAVLSPLMSTNLGVPHSSKIFATDASLHKGAILEAEIGTAISKVMHRALRSKGAYTRLMPAAAALIEPDEDKWMQPSGPERPIASRFDFLEIFAGSAKITQFVAETTNLVCGPPIDLTYSPEYDMKHVHLLSWITHMISEQRLGGFAVEPPCTTYSIMRRPALRDREHPYGYDPTHAQTSDGNILGQRAFQVLDAGGKNHVPGILETPHSSKLKNMPSWKAIARRDYTSTCRTDSCRFGSPHRKSFMFMGVHVHLESLALRCQCQEKHVVIEGKYTKSSATYVDPLAAELAKVLSSAILAAKKLDTFLDEIEASGLESQLVNGVMNSAPWILKKVWTFKRLSHINILELKVVQTLCVHLAIEGGRQRVVILVDSNVIRCAISKGRSSSMALSNVLVKLDSICVVSDLYLTVAFCPTRLNAADDPTRNQDVREPTRGICGDSEWTVEDLYALANLPRTRKWAANWMLLVLLMLGPKIVHHSNRGVFRHFGSRSIRASPIPPMDFDSTLGFPGEGPSRILTRAILLSPSAPLHLFCVSSCVCGLDFGVTVGSSTFACAMPIFPRNPADRARAAARASAGPLREGRRVTDVTSNMRRSLLTTFYSWIREEGLPWEIFMARPHQYIEEINTALTAYGRALHKGGRPLQHYSETINGIVATKPSLKRHLHMAWSLAFGWVQAEPSTHHVAMPFQVLMAVLSLCIAWGWHNVGGCLALGWGAFLRAGEVINGLRRDLLLPRDVEGSITFGLFSILEPKTRNVAARHQSAKLDVPDLLQYVQITLGDLQPHQRLWPHSGQTLRNRLKTLLQQLGLPIESGHGVKPLDLGSLRAGGATWALTMTENPELIRRRGRWLNAKTMEVYVQELAATQYLSLVPAAAKEKIFTLARAFPFMLASIEAFHSSGLPKSSWHLLVPKGEVRRSSWGWRANVPCRSNRPLQLWS